MLSHTIIFILSSEAHGCPTGRPLPHCKLHIYSLKFTQKCRLLDIQIIVTFARAARELTRNKGCSPLPYKDCMHLL